MEPVLSRTSSRSAGCLVRLAVLVAQLVSSVTSVAVLAMGAVLPPIPLMMGAVLIPLPPPPMLPFCPPAPLTSSGVGPPQATKTAAAAAAAPQSPTQLIRLIIFSPVIVTSLNIPEVNRVSPKRATRSLCDEDNSPALLAQEAHPPQTYEQEFSAY